jgi:hypothetical protein
VVRGQVVILLNPETAGEIGITLFFDNFNAGSGDLYLKHPDKEYVSVTNNNTTTAIQFTSLMRIQLVQHMAHYTRQHRPDPGN